MRIRKNANLSTIMEFSAPEWRLQTHVCHMNQSPWDVINFSDETYPAALNQFGGGDNSFAVNTSLGDSAGVAESMESMMDEDDKDMEMEMETENDNGGGKDEELTKIKKKKFCSSKTSVSAKRGGVAVVDRGSRPGRAKKGSSWNSSNPYEFYYYSGFGPLWGKRRAGRNESGGEAKIKRKSSNSKEMDGFIIQNTTLPPSSSPSLIDRSEELDFVEEEDDYEDDDDNKEQRGSNGGKNRVRKLVKARSLKSLM